jgi:hypothetical protein
MGIAGWIGDNKGAIAFTAVVMILGTAGFFAFGAKSGMMGSGKADPAVYNGITYKVAFAPDGTIKVFANAKNNALAKLEAVEGGSIPEEDSMTIGFAEAMMMKNESLFAKPGDSLINFFGIDRIYIGGVLAETGSPVDDLHFLGMNNFNRLEGEQGRVFSKLTPDSVPKMFYHLGIGEPVPEKFVLAEGSMSGYEIHDLGGVSYYPIVIGSKEAKMMRKENLFKQPGDVIRGFFGKNVVIVGVLQESGTALDMMHFVPLKENEIG